MVFHILGACYISPLLKHVLLHYQLLHYSIQHCAHLVIVHGYKCRTFLLQSVEIRLKCFCLWKETIRCRLNIKMKIKTYYNIQNRLLCTMLQRPIFIFIFRLLYINAFLVVYMYALGACSIKIKFTKKKKLKIKTTCECKHYNTITAVQNR